MTIGKKLYFGFGAILMAMLILFVINIFTVTREYSARSAAAATLSDVQSIEDIRFEMMENRLNLGNYLLSGDIRDEDKTNHGINDLLDLIKQEEGRVSDPALRSSLSQVEENERGWSDNFAKQMLAKRHQVDAGDITVSDLQIFYLQHDPASWTTKSSAVLDDANRSVRRALDDSNASAAAATRWSTIITT
ncbi:MAG: CHASE3 domain-containing protein, partial [Blastocatellia bacterium]